MDKLVIILAIIHAYVFAIMLFSKPQAGASLLGLYMLSFFIQSFLFGNFHIFQIENLNILFYLCIASLSLVDFPLIFFYIRTMSVPDFKFRFKHYLHFLPAALLFVLQLVAYFVLDASSRHLLSVSYEMINLPEFEAFNFVYTLSVSLLILQVIVYSILILVRLYRHRRNIENYYSYKHKISLNWLYFFVGYYFLYYLFEIAVYSFLYYRITETTYFAIVSLHIFIIGIFGLKQREIYDKKEELGDVPEAHPTIGEPDTPIKEKLVDEVKSAPEEKKKQALLSEDLTQELAEKITEMIESEKLYLDPELSLKHLADKLEIHKNYVSFVINASFKVNFYNFINKYRIEEAKRLLSDDQYNHWSVEGIAKSCGFKSRNVFYPIFKKSVGVTPKEFKKQKQEIG